jgi:hypothetical protein
MTVVAPVSGTYDLDIAMFGDVPAGYLVAVLAGEAEACR